MHTRICFWAARECDGIALVLQELSVPDFQGI